MTILVIFQMSRFRDFKNFYCGFLSFYHKSYFPNLPSYGRFVNLINRAIFPLTIFTQIKAGKQTGIYYIDSSCLPVCHIKRSRRHKTFNTIAEYGKTSVGWFFGLKLHIVTNDKGELLAFKITTGSKSDSKEAVPLLKSFKGLAFGDKGYIGKKIFEELLNGGLKLITRKRKNMKVWHTRHRSIMNAMTHLVAALAAYVIEPLKLSAIKLLANCA